MTLNEVKIEVLKRNKKMDWIYSKLGYSKQYFYSVFRENNTKEIERIKKILENN